MVSSLSRHVLLEGPEEINSEIEVKGKPPPTDKDFGKYLCVWFFKYLFFFWMNLPSPMHLKKPMLRA